jgi:hypothetical protein
MPRSPEPVQTSRVLAVGAFLWVINAALRIVNPSISSTHLQGVLSTVLDWTFWGGLLMLAVGMFLRATSWVQDWRDGTDRYQPPSDVVVSERLDFPADDDEPQY